MKTFVQLIEDIKSADKKPEVYIDASGKQKYRMVSKNKAVMKEKTLTPAEKKKREEIATAMERENPGMDMSKKMAIATAAAKRVAESVVLDEAAYMSGSSADRAEAHHDQAQKHFDAAENAHSTSEASAHRYAARAHVKAGMSHEKRAENPASKTATAVAAVSSHAHKLTQMAGRFDESVELEEAELDEISKNALMNYRTSAKIHRRQNDEIIGSQMASNKQVNKAEKDNVKRTKGIDMAAKKIATKESVELGEVTRSAVKRPMQYTDARGITRTKMTSTRPVQHDQHGQEKITESRAKRLDEAFAAGAEKLSDGSIVILKKQDADLLNNLFKDLNPANKKKMMKVAMTDKAGFNEILGFAREAL